MSTIETNAIDRGLNCAVMTMANITAPGWDVSSDAPQTYEELIESADRHGRIIVWDGESDGTIFGEAEFNYAFRAWHDSVHLRYGYDFTFKGEVLTAIAQCDELATRFAGHHKLQDWQRMILIEVIGQALHFKETGEFPEDQIAFFHKAAPSFSLMV